MLVALALACGPLGVNVEPDPSVPYESAAVCMDPGPEVGYQTVGSPVPREEIIPLNTRGYNYVRPGTGRPSDPIRSSPR